LGPIEGLSAENAARHGGGKIFPLTFQWVFCLSARSTKLQSQSIQPADILICVELSGYHHAATTLFLEKDTRYMHIGWVQSKCQYSGIKRKFSFIMLGFERKLAT